MRAGGRRNMTKLKVAIRNSANILKKISHRRRSVFLYFVSFSQQRVTHIPNNINPTVCETAN